MQEYKPRFVFRVFTLVEPHSHFDKLSANGFLITKNTFAIPLCLNSSARAG